MGVLGVKLCKHNVATETFISFSTRSEYCIKPDNSNCCFNNVGCLSPCTTFSKQYTGSTESFRSRLNNYKSAHRNFIKGNTVKQVSFHAHFQDDWHGVSDWEITPINQTENVHHLSRRESFWQYELDTFQSNEINELDVARFSCVHLLNLYVIFIFSSLTHYIYRSTLISTIFLCMLTIEILFTHIVIIVNHCYYFYYYYYHYYLILFMYFI